MKLTFRGNSYEVPAPIQLGPDNRMERTVVQSGHTIHKWGFRHCNGQTVWSQVLNSGQIALFPSEASDKTYLLEGRD
jgi:hypothetical protein